MNIRDMEKESSPRQTIVIPIRNEREFIASTIKFVQGQDYPKDRLEIIVVDGDSDDGTAEIAAELAKNDPCLKLLNNPGRLSSAARNIGARAAGGEIITFIDGHTYIDNPSILKNIASTMSENNVSVLSRPQFLETPDNTFFQRAVALARRSVFGHGLDSTIYLARDDFVDPTSSGATYKREVFEKVGYFDERFDAAEDWEFNYRVHLAGYRSFSSLGFAVYYYPRTNLRGLFHQMKRYGIGRFRFFRKHRTGLSSGALFPIAIVLGLPLLCVLSILNPLFLRLLAFVAGLYLVVNLGFSLNIAATRGWKYIGILPFTFLAVHWGLGWGFVSELLNTLFGKRRWTDGK